jgi:uncharacterized protein YndB with AHSA1/START domain
MVATTTDRIERQILLRAPRSRVWRALTDSAQFGEWFGVAASAAFTTGARIRGAVKHKGYEHLTWDVVIEQMVPERLFSWRWHPGADPADESEPTTLVVFELQDAPGGTLLTVVESGFDAIPIARRHKAYRDNDEGWSGQMESIERYVIAHP